MKKIITKILAVAVVGAMGLAMAGCAGSGTDAKKLTVEEGKLIMATNAYFPPYEFYEGDKIVGIDQEIAAEVATRLGLELEIQDIEFDSIITGVQSGKYDIGCAGMTVTEDRLQSVNFTTPYATGIQSVIVKEGSEIVDVDTLLAGDYIVGVQQGTTGDIYMSDDIGDERVERFNKGADAVLALTNGQVDAVVIDDQPAQAFVQANAGLQILSTSYAVEDYAMCLNKSSEELLNKINETLAAMKADGTIDAIIEEYIPSNG
ncbi:polar amino acid transport system substrate-binding protein [Ruminococcaceae bacterium YRB3002]|nr:polar amino acid transport system substrate-binding protein [Ruminococcaceae bacterium YRB3002]